MAGFFVGRASVDESFASRHIVCVRGRYVGGDDNGGDT